MEAIVEYNYVAQEPDELTLRKGDIVKEIKVMPGGWWEGTLRDKRGMFPDNFVKVLEPVSGKPGNAGGAVTEPISSGKSEEVNLRNGGSGRRWCKVLFNYKPCNRDELTLVPDDFIEYLSDVEEGWWKGRLRGRVGVFPSNFVTPAVYEDPEKQDRDKIELCRALFPYKAGKKDELTLVKGDIVTLLSRDAPDKGWWKGELRGQVGLFPDNFVEVIGVKKDPKEQEQWHEGNIKSAVRHSHQAKKSEKTNAQKNLDTWNAHTDTLSSAKLIKKAVSPSSVSSTSTSPEGGSNTGDRKPTGGHSIISSLKQLVGEPSTNNGNGSTNAALGEELDGVERGEGAPLSHLTASRAKAPRRRPPSSGRLRHYATGSSTSPNDTPLSLPTATLDDDLANGSTDMSLAHLWEEYDGLVAKQRKKAPWVEELKLNQLERKKIGADRLDKPEIKVSTSPVVPEAGKLEGESEETKPREKDKVQEPDSSPNLDQLPAGPNGSPAYVPYFLYSQLLDRVAALEEKQVTLQQTVEHLYEHVLPYLPVNNKE